MSRRKPKRGAAGPDDELMPAELKRAVDVLKVEPERRVEAVALLRGQGGHSIVKLSLPLSVVEQYATDTEPPELRAIVAGKLVQWVEGVA